MVKCFIAGQESEPRLAWSACPLCEPAIAIVCSRDARHTVIAYRCEISMLHNSSLKNLVKQCILCPRSQRVCVCVCVCLCACV